MFSWNIYEKYPLACLHTLALAAFILFLYGFFPMENPLGDVETESVENSLSGGKDNRVIHKLVFMIIDALRLDFVIGNDFKFSMPYLQSKLKENKTCIFTTTAQAPTVTLPRLKALLSGTIPTFLEFLFNMDASYLKQKSFLQDASSSGYKLVFHGDNIWIKLFPNSFFRSQGFDVMFSNYDEIDLNITKNIEKELSQNDWDGMFIHYPGLDHIGHLYGPTSPLIKKKLQEMDTIISKITGYLLRKEKEDSIKTLFLITGDHGMKDTGGHGGNTFAEVTVPLLSMTHPCSNLQGWPSVSNQKLLQVDIAPTLYSLFGLKIPKHNMGKIVPELLIEMPPKEVLMHLEKNKNQLLHHEKLSHLGDITEESNKLLNVSTKLKHESENLIERMAKQYFKELSDLSETLVRLNTEVKFSHMILACILLWLAFLIFLLNQFRHFPKPSSISQYFLLCGSALPTLSCASTSFIEEEHQTWYFLWSTFCCLMLWETLKNFKLSIRQKFKNSVSIIYLCILHRILRKLNQTGDKWSHLPDIGDYVNSEERKTLLFFLVLMGMVILISCAYSINYSKFQFVTYIVAIVLTLMYRTAVSTIDHPFLSFYPHSRGTAEVIVFWIILSIFIFQTVRNNKPGFMVWSLFAALLLRSHNVMLIPLEIITSKLLYNLVGEEKNVFWNGLAHCWMGFLFYFYQGNGNSLADVDAFSGFIGLESHIPMYVGLMIASHTYSSHILSFLLSPRCLLAVTFLRLFQTAYYCTIVLLHLNHLFIWSVFAPKLLYEFSSSTIFFILICINSAYSFKQKKVV